MREAAGMAVDVQHRRAARQRGHEAAVVALVEEPAGFLPAGQVGEEADPVLGQFHRRGEVALDVSTALSSPSSLRTALSLRSTIAAATGRFQRLQNRFAQPLHQRRVELHRQHIAESVDDKAGQPVRLGMDQPVKGCVEQPVAHSRQLCSLAVSQAVSIMVFGLRSISRAAIRECGLNPATPTASPEWLASTTRLPGGRAFASAVMSSSLEKAQG